MLRIALLLLVLSQTGCVGSLFDAGYSGAPYFTLSGPVEVDAATIEGASQGWVAWAWYRQDSSSWLLEKMSFRPDILRYAMDIGAPPMHEDPAATHQEASTQLTPLNGVDILIGLPVMLAAPDNATVDFELDPEAMLDWASGISDDANEILITQPNAPVELMAVTREYLLMAMNSAERLERLDDHRGWPKAEACGLGSLLEGLTLYRRGVGECSPWQRLAPAGERTEFQGVEMRSPAGE